MNALKDNRILIETKLSSRAGYNSGNEDFYSRTWKDHGAFRVETDRKSEESVSIAAAGMTAILDNWRTASK